MDINLDEVCATRVWIERSQIPEVAVILNRSHSPQNLQVIVRGSAKTKKDFNHLWNAFQLERQQVPFLEWFKNTPRRFHLQAGNVLPREQRPDYTHPCTVAFVNWSEYLTVQGYGLVQEQELAHQGYQSIQGKRVGAAMNMRLYCMIPVLEDATVRLVPHDTFSINLDPELDDRAQDWHGEVMEPVPWQPIDYVLSIVTKSWSKEEKEWVGPNPERIIAYDALTDRAATNRIIQDTEPVLVTLNPITSDQIFRRNIVALEKLNTGNTAKSFDRELFLGNDFITLAKKDLYEFMDSAKNPLDFMDLNEKQKEAVQQARKAPEGLNIVVGPPGTGKTYLAIEMMTPFLLFSKKKVLLCSHSNQAVDKLAEDAINHIAKLKGRFPDMEDHMVIRCHSLALEQDFLILDAKKKRKIPAGARPPLVETATDED